MELYKSTQSQKLCPDCRQQNMRVKNVISVDHEVVKQWDCPHCRRRIEKVNRAATAQYRAEHPELEVPVVRRYDKKEKALIREFLEAQRKRVDLMLDFNATLDILIEEVQK